jgi:hypothetical protein
MPINGKHNGQKARHNADGTAGNHRFALIFGLDVPLNIGFVWNLSRFSGGWKIAGWWG